MQPNLSFIGLGAMGLAMARRQAARQVHVTGFDVRPEAMAALEASGGHAATSAADAVRDADYVFLVVVNADQVDSVLFEAGALEAMKTDATVVVMATAAPARVIETARRVTATGRRFVDAPVSGGVAGVEAGTLTIMAAAPADTFQRAEPVLRAIGSKTYHLGTAYGQGAAMKTVNQLLAGVHIAVAAEAFALAEKAGIDKKTALEILGGSAASSWMLRDRGSRMIGESDAVTSAIDIFVKDLAIVLDAGRAAKMGLPLAAIAHQLFLSASGMGHGRRDDSQVIEVYRAAGGTR
ncbi:MAG: NAD(P)-dependent oxidoreductase [Hyphomicrobiaceae bacterium]